MLNIYLTNLGKYNEDFLVGKWVELPCYDFEKVFDEIGINEEYEEYFITDFETDVNGLTVGEYDDLEELNDLAEAIEENPEAAEALIYFGYETAEEIREHMDDVIYITTPKTFETEEEAVGWYYAEEINCLEMPDFIKNYFDYESYGRDIMIDGSFYTAESGAIYEVIR